MSLLSAPSSSWALPGADMISLVQTVDAILDVCFEVL
jgi:hypothetical protein